MSSTFGPERWAIEISKVLNLVLGADHFPVNVAEVAREYLSQRFPGDAITLIRGANLPRFDGALFPASAGKSGWGIIYNDAIASAGRINFTLGHEFGHYLLHRSVYPQGIQCSAQDVVRWDSAYGQIESQANRFAAGLLMPLDDFRRQIPDTDAIDLGRIRLAQNAIACLSLRQSCTGWDTRVAVPSSSFRVTVSSCGRGRAMLRSSPDCIFGRPVGRSRCQLPHLLLRGNLVAEIRCWRRACGSARRCGNSQRFRSNMTLPFLCCSLIKVAVFLHKGRRYHLR